MIGALLLSGLPEEYRPMIMAIENSGIAITSDSIKLRLLQDVKPTNSLDSGQETAFHSKTKDANKRNTEKQRKCFSCGKPGHFAARCRSKVKKKVGENSQTFSNVFLTLAAAGKISNQS